MSVICVAIAKCDEDKGKNAEKKDPKYDRVNVVPSRATFIIVREPSVLFAVLFLATICENQAILHTTAPFENVGIVRVRVPFAYYLGRTKFEFRGK